MSRPRSAPDPRRGLRENWRALSAVALLALGIALVLLGWWGAAHTNIFTEQIPYLISGGLLGLGLIIVAGIQAFAAASERTGRELRRDVAFLIAGGAPDAASQPSGPARGARAFVVPGGRSYHVAGCPIVEGKDGARELDPAEAVGAGLTACKLCGP
ncbi:MAG: hypothetical protein HY775_10000 [Acidobacteria bacterium]|nr:hypothetical protein [Acidobacteriota bacterium]